MEISIDSPIIDKIRWAKNCYQVKGELLLKHTHINKLIAQFKKAILISHMIMNHIGITEECEECDKNGGGSCCGAGIEDKYSGTLLLINLLLGCKLPEKRIDPKSCFFLGKAGCVLLSRHTICINYICKNITNRINQEKITKLREKEGIELEFLFQLNEEIKKILRDHL